MAKINKYWGYVAVGGAARRGRSYRKRLVPKKDPLDDFDDFR